MPIKQAGKKALRQAKKRAARNLIVKNVYKSAVKTVKKSIAAGEQNISEKLRLAQKKLDKAVKRGIIKKNTAARKLSRLMKIARGSVAK